MTKRELIDYCLTLPVVYEDYPFDGQAAHSDDGTWTVMRHMGNKKSFAHIYERNDKLCINLKCDPFRADFLRSIYADLVPGWHMNKTHWKTVYFVGDVPIDELYEFINHSYDLTKQNGFEKICLFDTLPENLTYPEVTSEILPLVLKRLQDNFFVSVAD